MNLTNITFTYAVIKYLLTKPVSQCFIISSESMGDKGYSTFGMFAKLYDMYGFASFLHGIFIICIKKLNK